MYICFGPVNGLKMKIILLKLQRTFFIQIVKSSDTDTSSLNLLTCTLANQLMRTRQQFVFYKKKNNYTCTIKPDTRMLYINTCIYEGICMHFETKISAIVYTVLNYSFQYSSFLYLSLGSPSYVKCVGNSSNILNFNHRNTFTVLVVFPV